jgi:hypothetical protein
MASVDFADRFRQVIDCTCFEIIDVIENDPVRANSIVKTCLGSVLVAYINHDDDTRFSSLRYYT